MVSAQLQINIPLTGQNSMVGGSQNNDPLYKLGVLKEQLGNTDFGSKYGKFQTSGQPSAASDKSAGGSSCGSTGGSSCRSSDGGAHGAGGNEQLLDSLVDALCKSLLQKKGDGATFNNAGDNPLMEMIARFMDQSQGKYGAPDDATGNVRSWTDEMSEDNYLNKEELHDFIKGLRGALANALGGQGCGGTGSAQGSSELADTGGCSRGASDGLANNQSCQSGVEHGNDFAGYVGQTALDAIGTHNDSATRFFVNKEDRGMAKEIGHFMDQNPEVFGKPEYQKDGWSSPKTDTKNWADALSKPDDDGMTPQSMDKFKEAIGMLKDTMASKSIGNDQMNMDATLTANTILSQAMQKIG